MKASQQLVIGQVYTRAQLREQFEITAASLKNGIFKPPGFDSIWMFITENKTPDRVQFKDSLDGDVLTMEGQSLSRTDHMITDHVRAGNELLLFYRHSKSEYPGAGFVYEGPFRYVRHEGSKPAAFTLERAIDILETKRRTWDLALEAVIGLGGSASPAQVRAFILARHPNYNTSNVQPDLSFLSVNSPSRTSYHHNDRPRRTDQGNEYDKLFKVGSGRGVVFEFYDPAEHGVWEIYEDPTATSTSGLSVRQVSNAAAHAVVRVENEVEEAGEFDVHGIQDARHRVLASIVRRRGQAQFRKALLAAYGGACAFTGCTVTAILEAAHVHPYMDGQTNSVSNGLLLRADIHTLFDLGLIAIESIKMTVRVSPELAGTEYATLDGRELTRPALESQRVNVGALDWHRSRCGW